MSKKHSLVAKTDQELKELVATTRMSLRGERFAAAGARAKDPSSLGKMRKVIARALTEQGRRSRATVA